MGRQLEQFQKLTVTSFLQNILLHGWLIKGWGKSLLANEHKQLKAHIESISIISPFPTEASPTSQLHKVSPGLCCHRGPLPWVREQNPTPLYATAPVSLSCSAETGPGLWQDQIRQKNKKNEGELLIRETLFLICSPGMPHDPLVHSLIILGGAFRNWHGEFFKCHAWFLAVIYFFSKVNKHNY